MTSSNNQMHNDIMAAGSKKQIEGENNDQKGELIAKTYQNTTAKVQDLTDAEAEVVQMILNGIGNDIYSTVDACPNANEIKDERIARNGNPLALVAATQHYPDNYPQAPKPYKTQAPSSRQRTSTRSHDTTKKKGKEGVQLSVKQSEWLHDIDDELDDQELKAHYMYMIKIQEVDSNAIPDSSSMCTNEREVDKNAGKKEDEHVEFKRISLTGFRSCTNRSRYKSVSEQTARISILHCQMLKSTTLNVLARSQG
ncbi:hypothetical protein Tco_0521172 [Tanacetum coccineum]